MADVLVPQDPVLRARAYLLRYFPRVEVQVPPKWAWDDLLVVLTDTGGAGEYDRVLSDARITVEVSHPRIKNASEAARVIQGLLREWQHIEDGVYWRSEVGRPAFYPDDETGTPKYIQTVSLAFRSEPRSIPQI